MSGFAAAFHESVQEGSVQTLGSTVIEPISHIKYVGITDLSVHVELQNGTLIRVTNSGIFSDGLNVEVTKKDANA